MKLLEHFKEISLHPKNAEELKGLILQLAVQGKLTVKWREKNMAVESADDLLFRSETARLNLISNKVIRKSNLETIIDDELYNIPDTWRWSRIGAVMNIVRGVSFKKSEVFDNPSEGFIGVLRGQNMKQSLINRNELIYIDKNKVKDIQIIRKGDVAITLSSGSPKLVGKIGVSHLKEELTIGAFYGKLLFMIEEMRDYIVKYLDSPLYKKQLLGAFRGIGINNLSNEKVQNLMISIPPIEEQKAIVEVVNTLFAEVEQLESLTKERLQLKESFVVSALARLTEAENTQQEWNFLQQHFSSFFTEKKNIKSLRETILQLAVQGKLTEGWRANNPNTEPASELLKRIEAEKQQLITEKKIKTSHKLHGKAKKEPSFKVPESWECRRFWDVVWCYRGHNPPKSDFIQEPREGYVRFIQITDFKTDSRAVYVPESHKLKRVQRGEILMAAYRHIGKLSRRMEGAFNVALCKVNCIEPFNIDFLELLIGTPVVKGELLAESERGHIPSMHSDHLLSLWVPVPPLEEQKAIVEKVNSLMALCDELELQIETSQTQIEQLMQSCLQEVFEHESN
jgi:type I restriction enzyme S subunit